MIRRYGKALRLTMMMVDGGLAAVLSLILYQATAHPTVPTDDFLDSFWMRAVLYGVGWVFRRKAERHERDFVNMVDR